MEVVVSKWIMNEDSMDEFGLLPNVVSLIWLQYFYIRTSYASLGQYYVTL